MTASPSQTSLLLAALVVVLGSSQVAPAKGASAKRAADVFVALESANQVAIVRGPSWRVVERVPVARSPHNAASSPNGRFVAVTSPPADRVTLLTASGRVLRSVRVSGFPT